MSREIKLLLSITPEPYSRAAERPFMNMPLDYGWEAVSTTEEDRQDKISPGKLFFYNKITKKSSWDQPAPLLAFSSVPTRLLKKKSLWFSGGKKYNGVDYVDDPYNPDDKDFNIEIKYPEDEDNENPWIEPTEEFDDKPHDHDRDGYVPDPDIGNFLLTQPYLQYRPYPYLEESMYIGDSVGTYPLSERYNKIIRDRDERVQDYVYFGLEPSNLRWDNKENIPSKRLNWKSGGFPQRM